MPRQVEPRGGHPGRAIGLMLLGACSSHDWSTKVTINFEFALTASWIGKVVNLIRKSCNEFKHNDNLFLLLLNRPQFQQSPGVLAH